MLSNEALTGIAKLAANYPETWTGGNTMDREIGGGPTIFERRFLRNPLSNVSEELAPVGRGLMAGYQAAFPQRSTMQRDQGYMGALGDELFHSPAIPTAFSNSYRAPAGVMRTVGGGLGTVGGGLASLLPSGMGGDTGAAIRDASIDMTNQGLSSYADAFKGYDADSGVGARGARDAQRSLDRANTQMQQLAGRNLTQGEADTLGWADTTTDIAGAMLPAMPLGGAAAAPSKGLMSVVTNPVKRVASKLPALPGQGTRIGQAVTRVTSELPGGATAAKNVNRLGRVAGGLDLLTAGAMIPVTTKQTFRNVDPMYVRQSAEDRAAMGKKLAPNATSSYRFYNDPGVQSPAPAPAVNRDPRSIMNPYARSVAEGQQPAPARPAAQPAAPVSRDPRSIMNPYARSVAEGQQPKVAPKPAPKPLAYRPRREHAITRGPNEGQSQFLSRARKQYNDTIQRRKTRAADFVKSNPSLFGKK